MPWVQIRQDQNHMATTFELTVAADERRVPAARAALVRAHAEIARLERELSEFLDQSPVWRLNHAPPGEPIEFTTDAYALLERARQLGSLTSHAFDVTAKSGDCGIPQLDRLRLDPATRRVARMDARVRLSFGAIGKGYALDRARFLLESEGFADFLLSAGGSSLVISGYAGPRGEPWQWGWSWKRDAEGNSLGLPLEHLNGSAVALGVSGLHEKGEHLLDSGTGLPCSETASLRSALVADRSAADADALSTALFVAGWDRGTKLIANLPASAPPVAVIERDETPRWNGVFESLWNLSRRVGTTAVGFALAFLVSPIAAIAQEETIDLDAMDTNSFTPYLFERDAAWLLLPAALIAFVLLHLKKYRPATKRKAANPFHKF